MSSLDELREKLQHLNAESESWAELEEKLVQLFSHHLEQETIILKSHLMYMAGEFEGYHGHKNGYLLKNWPEYSKLTPNKSKEK